MKVKRKEDELGFRALRLVHNASLQQMRALRMQHSHASKSIKSRELATRYYCTLCIALPSTFRATALHPQSSHHITRSQLPCWSIMLQKVKQCQPCSSMIFTATFSIDLVSQYAQQQHQDVQIQAFLPEHKWVTDGDRNCSFSQSCTAGTAGINKSAIMIQRVCLLHHRGC